MAEKFRLIEENSLLAAEDGFEVSMRLNWYRSLPYSCLEKLSVAIDGESIETEKLHLKINDQLYQLDQLGDLVEELWFVQDPATVFVHYPGKITPGKDYEIELELAMRAPYIPIGPDRFLTPSTSEKQTQKAK